MNEAYSDINRTRARIRVALCCGLLVACGLAARGEQEGSVRERIETARNTLEKWIETRRTISQEKQDWRLAQEMLGERIALVEHEIESLREKIDKTSTDISVADRKRAELVEKNEKLKRAAGVLEETLVDFEQRVKGLLARLPSPIQNQVKPLSQRIPEDPEDTKLSMGERFQNVIGILNEVNKFNGIITVTSEVRDLPGGGSAEVAAMYLGVGMAYYANKANEDESLDIAGVGVPGEDGWNWKPVNDAAPEIRRLIAIFRNEEVADFVQTPIEIQ